ncbi:uncharacterized protein MONBRDRAFT_35769 [Monosiga brevicollis MX1]|uniref:MRH domain-containing protein n=1 Tax=Monosiga brevicollis TaxID=81824 RepID=A9URQ9_MONBE|nr:uncharacterized protein MONBRDRAFT_35769 [Monosiga brevicollis MX1]EDQ91968.1 predicted protein [Monosiga brevicollis MX1]|eukprot:XP_001743254.1 hypothetical protein [Monosiga brevicollis MX1]
MGTRSGQKMAFIGLLLLIGWSSLDRATAAGCNDGCCLQYETAEGVAAFDLRPLTRTGNQPDYMLHDLDSSNTVYYINVCANLTKAGTSGQRCHSLSADSAACQALVDPSLAPAADRDAYPFDLGHRTTSLQWIDETEKSHGMELTYFDGTKCDKLPRQSNIQFVCNTHGRGHPIYEGELHHACEYLFRWETDLACANVHHGTEVECSVTDPVTKDYYDLSPLIRSTTNWEVLRLDGGGEDYSMEINVCRSLVPTGSLPATCADDVSAACQRKINTTNVDGTSFSLGQVATPQISDGIVKLVYEGGTPCGARQRRTIIELTCDPDSPVTAEPVYKSEIETCVYLFEWTTPYACPVTSKTSGGEDEVVTVNTTCTITTAGGFQYDFSAINTIENVEYNEEHRMAISFCDGGYRCGNDLAGICLTEDEDDEGPINETLASPAHRIIADGENLRMEFTAETCHMDPTQSFHAIVNFVCDPEATRLDANFIHRTDTTLDVEHDCEPVFELLTALACQPEAIPCGVPGYNFDLSDLTLEHDNWRTVDEDQEDGRCLAPATLILPESLNPKPCPVHSSTAVSTRPVYSHALLCSVTFNRLAGKYAYLINVCQNIVENEESVGCRANAGICQVLADPSSSASFEPRSLGQATQPYVNGDNELVIDFVTGDWCPAANAYRNASLILLCSEIQGSPVVLGEVSTCSYKFSWETPLACALHEANSTNCKATSPEGQIFDFSRLKDQEFIAKHDGQSAYHVSVCGTNSHCAGQGAVCNLDGQQAFGDATSKIQVEDDDVFMTLVSSQTCSAYGDMVKKETIISFVCPEGAHKNNDVVVFDDDGCTVLLTWYTDIVCTSAFKPIPCSVLGEHGDYYDLTRLVNSHSNYQAGGGGSTFQINVCRPVTAISGENCPVDAGVCQLDAVGDTDVSLGTPSAPQYDADRNQLYILYQGGQDGCEARLDFECSTSDEGLVFVEKMTYHTCLYRFRWRTPVACPVKVLKGKDCAVRDPVTNTLVNLTSLQATTSTGYAVTEPIHGYTFYVDICRAITCPGKTSDASVGACQTKPGDDQFPKLLGDANGDLMFEDDTLMLKYTGGETCGNSVHRTTKIFFECEEANPDDAPQFFTEIDPCIYVFKWKTPLACLPEIECRASNNGHDYHLDALKQSSSNYVAVGAGGVHFALNVCGRLNEQSTTCGGFSAACLTESSGEHISLGNPSAPYIAADGTLTLSYSYGDECTTSDGVETRYSARILFVCKNEMGYIGAPEYQYTSANGCEYVFTWQTSYACAEADDDEGEVVGDCKVEQNGNIFDLSALMNHDPLTTTYTHGTDAYKYSLSVCGKLGTSVPTACQGQGACQALIDDPSKANALGKPSARLYADDGTLKLQYANGSGCFDGSVLRSTTVLFRCNESIEADLSFLGENSCQYELEVATKYACQETRRVPCEATDPINSDSPSFDLSDLMKNDMDYVASSSFRVPGSTVIFNVCRTLVAPPSTACGGNSGICLNVDDKYYSLGNIQQPMINVDGQYVISYAGGDCPFTSGTSTATINLVCSPDGRIGVPELINTPNENCDYIFSWVHPLAHCENEQSTTVAPSHTLTKEDCIVTDIQGVTYDLTALAGKTFTAQSDSDPEYSYLLHVCGDLAETCQPGVGTAGACQKKSGSAHSLGHFTRAPYFKSGELVLEYTDGDSNGCGDGMTRGTVINFECAPEVDEGTPYYVGETNQCQYEFTWRTKYACGSSGLEPITPLECAVNHKGITYDFGELRRMATDDPPNWVAYNEENVSEKDKYVFDINVCGSLNHFAGMGACLGASMCQTAPNDASYAPRVVGQARHEPVAIEDDDGDVHFQLSYDLPQGFSTDCNGADRSAVINFYCAEHEGEVGYPIFIGESSACHYEFRWDTMYACAPKEAEVTGDCTVADPMTGQVYDLSPLGKAALPYTDGQGSYSVAICESHNGCSSSAGSGVCKGQQTGLGEVNANLTIVDHSLQLEYKNGDPCGEGTSTYSSVIQFYCDPEVEKEVTLDATADDCVNVFHVGTKYACPETTDMDCTVVSADGTAYDLSVLKRYTHQDSWQVRNEDSDAKHDYFINVCHLLTGLPTETRQCGNSAACQIEKSTGAAYKLGTLDTEPYLEDGKLKLHYSGGTACHVGGQTVERSTDIIFECNEDPETASPLGVPYFHAEDQACHYVMHWKTTAACPVKSQLQAGCVLRNPITNEKYAMLNQGASLTGVGVDKATDTSYTISVCDTITCGDDKAASGCQQPNGKGGISLGKSLGIEISPDGELVMQMQGGTSKCHGTYTRAATVTFQCVPSKTPTRVDFSGGYIDINVCAAVEDGGCSDNTAACLHLDGQDQAVSLGSFDNAKPQSLGNSVYLQYTDGGDDCDVGAGGAYSLQIDFVCSTTTTQTPKVTKSPTSSCLVRIEWPTCEVCPSADPCHDLEDETTTLSPSGAGGDKGSSQGGSNSGKHSKGGVIAAVVIVVALVAIGAGVLIMSPTRRASILGCFGRSTVQPQYQYRKMGDVEALPDEARNLFDDDDDDDDEGALVGFKPAPGGRPAAFSPERSVGVHAEDDDDDDDDEIIALD